MNLPFVQRLCACVVLLALLPGCYREQRPLPGAPATASPTDPLRLSGLQPGEPRASATASNPFEENAYAASQGKRLFKQYNCAGCHGGGGGGGMGPPLMDDKWIYGQDSANIYATIVQGRPNGMPSFGGHIPEEQLWQLVAYVRSLSGQLSSAVAPARGDSLSPGKAEQRREKEEPKEGGQPQQAQ
ncbi:c-type cytochrome|uniref:c-type cytochrome n=1 Tax=Noviherbaspirillum sp. L7-7A TaxID=2850560 RepID=UPI001C2B865B|nr:c-type cytochrome [Noviherbaspirillum sp. L7-7A]MBV0879867.1 c-type cytochrome [Noviherbaspirillum sp. L7-7A]